MVRPKKKKKNKKRAGTQRKKKKAGARARSTRTTKDGLYFAVNVYIHRTLLDLLDTEAEAEDRTRRAQLERVLCRGLKVEHAALVKIGAE